MSRTVWVLRICVFVSVLTGLVSSLSCYACVGTSWEDCDKNLKIFSCSNIPGREFDVCMKTYKRVVQGSKTVKEFSKMCAVKDMCAVTKEGCKTRGWDCKVECCSTNLCNRSSSTTLGISGMLFMIVMMVILYLK